MLKEAVQEEIFKFSSNQSSHLHISNLKELRRKPEIKQTPKKTHLL